MVDLVIGQNYSQPSLTSDDVGDVAMTCGSVEEVQVTSKGPKKDR